MADSEPANRKKLLWPTSRRRGQYKNNASSSSGGGKTDCRSLPVAGLEQAAPEGTAASRAAHGSSYLFISRAGKKEYSDAENRGRRSRRRIGGWMLTASRRSRLGRSTYQRVRSYAFRDRTDGPNRAGDTAVAQRDADNDTPTRRSSVPSCCVYGESVARSVASQAKPRSAPGCIYRRTEGRLYAASRRRCNRQNRHYRRLAPLALLCSFVRAASTR